MDNLSGQINIEHYPNGMLKSYQTLLEEEFYIHDEVFKVAENSVVFFYEAGEIKSLVAAEDCVIRTKRGKFKIRSGERVLFAESGEVLNHGAEAQVRKLIADQTPPDISRVEQENDSQQLIDQSTPAEKFADLVDMTRLKSAWRRTDESIRKKINRLSNLNNLASQAECNENLDGSVVIHTNPDIPDLESSEINFMVRPGNRRPGTQILIFDRGMNFITYMTDLNATEAHVEDLLPGRLQGRVFEVLILDPSGEGTRNILLNARIHKSDRLAYRVIFQPSLEEPTRRLNDFIARYWSNS